MNRPLIALHVIGGALSGLKVVAGEVEVLALGILPVVPDGLAVEAPELVAGDLHQHGALVDEGVVGSVGVDHPDAVDLLPGALVAVHQELRIGGREEQVVDPVGGVQEHLDGAGLFAVEAGLQPEGEEHDGDVRREVLLHHLSLVGWLIVRALGGAGDAVVGISGGSRWSTCPGRSARARSAPRARRRRKKRIRCVGIAARAV